jgi:hypothetical protein
VKIRRREAADVLERDGETAVLIDGSVILLSELSAAIYALCESPTEDVALARELETQFGAPVGGSVLQATRGALSELVRHRVIVVEEVPDGAAPVSP